MLTQPQVAAADYVELNWLVIEAAWRADIEKPDTLHQLFTDDGVLDMGNGALTGRAQIEQWGQQAVQAALTTASGTSAATHGSSMTASATPIVSQS